MGVNVHEPLGESLSVVVLTRSSSGDLADALTVLDEFTGFCAAFNTAGFFVNSVLSVLFVSAFDGTERIKLTAFGLITAYRTVSFRVTPLSPSVTTDASIVGGTRVVDH